MAPVVGIQSLPACLPQSLHHTGSQPREEIAPGSRTRASRVAAVPSRRVKAAAAHSDPLAGLSEASGGVWGTEVSQGPHPHLSGAAHSISAGAQQASCLSIFRARTCSVLLGQLDVLLAGSESARGRWRAEVGVGRA